MRAFLWDALALIGFAAVGFGLGAIYWPLAPISMGALLVIIGLRGPAIATPKPKDGEPTP